jgi:hypothetical protein
MGLGNPLDHILALQHQARQIAQPSHLRLIIAAAVGNRPQIQELPSPRPPEAFGGGRDGTAKTDATLAFIRVPAGGASPATGAVQEIHGRAPLTYHLWVADHRHDST